MRRGSGAKTWTRESEEEHLGQWHERFLQSCERYDTPWASPADQAEAVAGGLRAWADLVPQQQTTPSGEHQPANTWGLAPELQQVQLIIAHMVLRGHAELAALLDRMGQELQAVSAALDECYPLLTKADKAAEARLSRFARQQARSLAALLMRLRKRLASTGADKGEDLPRPSSKGRPSVPPALPKRAQRARNIERIKAELVEHIKSAADHARAAIAAGREAELLPRPTKAELGRRLGLGRWVVSRCFSDPLARELRMLWEMADDLEAILRRA